MKMKMLSTVACAYNIAEACLTDREVELVISRLSEGPCLKKIK